MLKKTTPIIFSGIWITLSEFIRNELLFKSYWTEHYQSLNLTFETKPINGILWMVWSFLLAFFLSKMLKKFSKLEAIGLTWLVAFVMMWITIFNLQVLPLSLLIFAIPLSLLEVFIAGEILLRPQKTDKK